MKLSCKLNLLKLLLREIFKQLYSNSSQTTTSSCIQLEKINRSEKITPQVHACFRSTIMSSFRVHDEKPSPPIYLMKWNPKLDLIALVYFNDEIALHRLVEYQKVWSLSLGIKVSSPQVADIDWRPDGKVLAVAYNRNVTSTVTEGDQESSIVLIDIESAEVIHVIRPLTGLSITCLSWTCQSKSMFSGSVSTNSSLTDYFPDPEEVRKILVRPLQPLQKSSSSGSKSFGSLGNSGTGLSSNTGSTGLLPMRRLTEATLEDLMLVNNTKCLNILCFGSKDGKVLMYSLGLLKIAEFHVSDSPVTSVHLSDTMSRMTVVHSKGVSTHSVNRLKNNCNQILAVSLIHAQVLTLSRYIKDSIVSLLEIWEEIMIDMETKLSFYFKASGDSNTRQYPTANELIVLLVFGQPSKGLEKFLKDMGDKGLKKLGHSIEVTYTNLQKIVVMNLQRVCYHLHFHVNLLKGMSLWTQEFGELGLDTQSILSSLKSIGSFLMKAVEFQQVIDISVRNVKVFFRWLFTVMYRLYGNASPNGTNETPNTPVTQEIIRISQQDLETVQEFIDDNFEHLSEDEEELSSWEVEALEKDKNKKNKCKPKAVKSTRSSSVNSKHEGIFTLDHVGQYLQDMNLKKPPLRRIDPETGDVKDNQSPWIEFLESKEGKEILSCLEDTSSVSIYPHNDKTSLVQECDSLMESLVKAFQSVELSLSLKEDLYSASISTKYSSATLDSKTMLSSHLTNVIEGCCYTCLAPVMTPSTQEEHSPPALIGIPFASHAILMKQSLLQDRTKIEVNFIRFVEGLSSKNDSFTESLDKSSDTLFIVQIEFYDIDHLFVLMRDVKGNTFIARIPIYILMEGSSPDDGRDAAILSPPTSSTTISLASDLSSDVSSGIHYRKMSNPGQKWPKMAVSGPRKVACISSLRKVKIFETDLVEGEDQDDLEEDIEAMDTTANDSNAS